MEGFHRNHFKKAKGGGAWNATLHLLLSVVSVCQFPVLAPSFLDCVHSLVCQHHHADKVGLHFLSLLLPSVPPLQLPPCTPSYRLPLLLPREGDRKTDRERERVHAAARE